MKHIPNALFLCLFLALGGLAQSIDNSKKSDLPDPKRDPPKIDIDSQLNSPLRATAYSKWVNGVPDGISLDIKVENVSAKAIRAYTTRNRSSIDESTARGCFLLNITKPGKVLQPGQSELRTTWRGYPREYSEPLQLSVDFVEFTDESVWGLDTCQSADMLAGQRDGARNVVEKLQEMFAEGGPQSVGRALDNRVLDTMVAEIEIPLDKSFVWKEAFLSGRQQMLENVRQFIRQNGVTEVEAGLKQPYDASGYKIAVVLPKPENQEDK